MFKKRYWCFPIATLLLFSFGVLSVNLSDSLPKTLFLNRSPSLPLKIGQIVSIEHPLLNIFVGKIIGGLPGDHITILDDVLFVNDLEIGPIKTISKSGKTYHPIPEGPISEGHYFVYATHPESFDSRYKEFGLVKEEWITGVLCPLL